MCIPIENPLIGDHYGKRKSFFSTVSYYHKTVKKDSIQIFTGSPKSWARKEPCEKDLDKTKRYVKENNINLFIHALYFINFGRKPSEVQQAIENLKFELRVGPKMGAKGIVFHVGKYLKEDEDTAIKNMYDNIISVLPFVDEICPLLLETPAGQGTECLTDQDDFIAFYKQFTVEEKKKFKVCIDSCHVFSSGYFPMEYINHFLTNCPNSLQVIHFNDSKTEKGSKKDRHEFPGHGFIGVEEMAKVANWGIANKIPMIIE